MNTITETDNVYQGMQFEVMSASGELLFEGRLSLIIREDFLELERTSEMFDPVREESTEVQARGFNVRLNYGIWMKATLQRLSGNRNEMWLLKNVRVVGRDSGRTFTRQYTGAKGKILPEKSGDTKGADCDIVNVSAGGVCVRTSKDLKAGDAFRLHVDLRPEKALPPFNCVVRRVISQKDGVGQYGCSFVQAGNDEIDRNIIKMIIELQLSSL